MGTGLTWRPTSPEVRTAAFYFTLYLTVAVANPYLPIWLADKGIAPEAIGIVNAVPILVTLALNMAVGRIADRAKDWRSVIVVGALIGGIVPLGLFLVDEFWGILLVWTLVILPFQATAPVVDAAAIHMTRSRGSDFAVLRAWGTVGFVLVIVIGGFLMDWYGPAAFVPLIVVVNMLRAGVSLLLPAFRGHERQAKAPAAQAGPSDRAVASSIREASRPWFMLTLVGTGLLHGSHMLQMGFGALLWREAGIPAAAIGPLWAIAPACEIFAMLFFARMVRRFSARHLLLAACLLGAVRWVGLAFDPEIWVLVILQTFHFASFGLAYMGIVNFIANWTSPAIAAQAQSYFFVIRQSAAVLALLAFGYLVAAFGSFAYFVAALVALIGGAMILASLLMMRTK